MKTLKALLWIIVLLSFGCSGNSENAHTTATTFVSPPPRQVLRAAPRATRQVAAKPDDPKLKVDIQKPLLIFNLPNEKTFREGEEVVIDFSLANARLKGDGGEYRVRYIVDDDDARFIEKWEPIWLSGWLSGKHTVRLELLDKDDRPVANGTFNTTAREITVAK